MNIAYFLLPKSRVAFLYDDYSVRQGLEKMKYHGYSAIPVITREGKYAGTVTEGDFLWCLLSGEAGGKIRSMKELEKVCVRDILSEDSNPAVRITVSMGELFPRSATAMASYPPVGITVSMEELMNSAMNHNFVPVVDDLGSFTGIVTRKDIIRYFSQKRMARPAPGSVRPPETARVVEEWPMLRQAALPI